MGSATSTGVFDPENDYRCYAKMLVSGSDPSIIQQTKQFYLKRYKDYPQVTQQFSNLSRRMALILQSQLPEPSSQKKVRFS